MVSKGQVSLHWLGTRLRNEPFHLHQRIAGLVEEVYTRTIHRKAA